MWFGSVIETRRRSSRAFSVSAFSDCLSLPPDEVIGIAVAFISFTSFSSRKSFVSLLAESVWFWLPSLRQLSNPSFGGVITWDCSFSSFRSDSSTVFLMSVFGSPAQDVASTDETTNWVSEADLSWISQRRSPQTPSLRVRLRANCASSLSDYLGRTL